MNKMTRSEMLSALKLCKSIISDVNVMLDVLFEKHKKASVVK